MWGELYGKYIISGRYEYTYVASRRPDLKAEIDAYLIGQDRADLIEV